MADEYATRTAGPSTIRLLGRRPDISAVDALTRIIEDTVVTDSWKDNGGAVGIMREFAGQLLVAQTLHAHEQIAALMDDIQAASRSGDQPPMPPDPAPEILNKNVGNLDFVRQPLWDVLIVLAQRSKAQIMVNWKSLEGAGIDANTPVTLRLVGATLEAALSSLVEQAGGGAAKIAFSIDDNGLVHVATADELARNSVTRVYNIRDLIDIYLNFHRGHGEFRMSAAEAADQITQIIETSVEPDGWKDNGGAVGSIREFAGLLVIQNTAENHRKIKTLLDRIRAELFAAMPRG